MFANGYGNVENLGNIYRRGFGPLQVECGITDGFTLKRGKKGKLEEVPKPKAPAISALSYCQMLVTQVSGGAFG